MESVGFKRWIASLVISVRIGSIGTIRKLTPNTAATPANAAASPASGCRPRLRNAAAPSGIKTRYPASAAMLASTPTVTRIQVTALRGVTWTIFLIRAVIKPACSASPTPIMTTRMMPTGAKFMKFRAIEVSMKRMPTPLSRLLTAAVGLRVDDPVIDRCPKQVKQMQEDNHQPRQEEENQRRMGNL